MRTEPVLPSAKPDDPPTPAAPPDPHGGPLSASEEARVDRVIEAALARGDAPGAVVFVIRGGVIALEKAYGHRRIEPASESMTVDTVFDLASLTKPLVTATAILQLVERGKLSLDDPVTRHRPSFGQGGKEAITVAQLLGHTSGLPAYNPLGDYSQGNAAMLARIDALEIDPAAPRERVYSDVGYILLGTLVASLSGEPLEAYARRHVFEPLGMSTAMFAPGTQAQLVAPTERRKGVLLTGTVHDPRAATMGGVAGHAGLFASARDVARFALMILGHGELGTGRVMSPRSTLAFIEPHPDAGGRHGLGLEAIDGGSGHTGFTGTSLWLDPTRGLGVVLMTSRLHPDGKGDVKRLRSELRELVGQLASNVMSGADVLADLELAPLKGRRVGLVTNHTGRTRDGRRTVDVLHDAANVELISLFSPEHGLGGGVDEAVADGRDEATSLPIHSLYGKRQRPDAAQLAGIDTLVVDLQDVGARFYTYATTVGYLLEAAKAHRLRLVILDRPNPLGGEAIEGPLLDEGRESFIGYHPIPVRHGMTLGELAKLFDAERRIGADLHVVAMRGWRRRMLWSDTGMAWATPSPNLRSAHAALLYPGVALLEASNVSVGRGTDRPFELVGAPWIDGSRLAEALSRERLAGVEISPAMFTPTASKHKDARSGGVRLRVLDPPRFEPVRLGIALARAIRALHPADFRIEAVLTHLGDTRSHDMLRAGAPLDAIVGSWTADVEAFRRRREPFLIYR